MISRPRIDLVLYHVVLAPHAGLAIARHCGGAVGTKWVLTPRAAIPKKLAYVVTLVFAGVGLSAVVAVLSGCG